MFVRKIRKSSIARPTFFHGSKIVRFDHQVLSTKYKTTMINTMIAINQTPRDHSGIWYYDDFEHYCRLNNIQYFPHYETGHANPEFFIKKNYYNFQVKKGKKASDALGAFLNEFTIMDCGNGLSACQYNTLLHMIEDERFNLIFGDGACSLTITQDKFDFSPLIYFFDFSPNMTEIGTLGNRPINPGELCHIQGLPEYEIKHPAGCYGGYNLICVGKNHEGEDLFIGFGPSTFRSGPLTEKELYKIFIYGYNLDRNRFDLEFIESSGSDLHRFDMKVQGIPEKVDERESFSRVKGFLPRTTIGPNYEKIKKIINTPVSETLEVFMPDYHAHAAKQRLRIELRSHVASSEMRSFSILNNQPTWKFGE